MGKPTQLKLRSITMPKTEPTPEQIKIVQHAMQQIIINSIKNNNKIDSIGRV